MMTRELAATCRRMTTHGLRKLFDRLKPRPKNDMWNRLCAHPKSPIFVEPNADDIGRCETIRQAFLPVLTQFGIDADQFFSGSIKNDDARALHALVRQMRPAMAYQVGTFAGYSAMIIASALQVGGGGRLVACDPEIPHRTLVNPVDVAREMATRLQLDDRIRFVRGWNALPIGEGYSNRYSRSIPVAGRTTLQEIPDGVNFAFIDGDHSTTGTTCDLALLHEFLAVNGTIVFHDVRSWPTVARALESFLTDNYFLRRGTPHYYAFDCRAGFDGLAALRKLRAPREAMLRVRVLASDTRRGVPHALIRLPDIAFEGHAGADGTLFVFGEVRAGSRMETTAKGFNPCVVHVEHGTEGDFEDMQVLMRPSQPST